MGLLAGGVIALPNFLWQWHHGFPFLEFRHDVALQNRDIVRGPIAFVWDQVLLMEPITAPLWIAGVVWLIVGRERRRYGLPHAISKHNSYWLWGPGDATGEIVIVLHSDGSGDRRHFETVEKAGRVEHPFSRRDEWYDIFVCRRLNFDLQAAWPKMKSFG